MGRLAGLMALEEYVTAAEAARVLDYNVQSVRRLVRGRTLEANKWAGVSLIYCDAVTEYLQGTAGTSKNDLYCFRRKWTNASKEIVCKKMEVGRMKGERRQYRFCSRG